MLVMLLLILAGLPLGVLLFLALLWGACLLGETAGR
jgi:hypothetical protein